MFRGMEHSLWWQLRGAHGAARQVSRDEAGDVEMSLLCHARECGLGLHGGSKTAEIFLRRRVT